MRFFSIGALALYSTVAGLFALGGDDGCEGEPTPVEYPPGFLVGAEVVTILPQVDGSTSYFDAVREQGILALEPGDPGDYAGVFVEEWDVGTLSIGNGERSSHWVHDDIRAGAVAFRDPDQADGKIMVWLTLDLYMLFRPDIEDILVKLEDRIGSTRYGDLEVIVTASHNHMGPDTSGLSGSLNTKYYDYMTDQAVVAIEGALDSLEPARLKVASSRYQFGLADSYAPYITDPTLNTMQAISASDPDRILATVVQWQNHPEDTLGFGKSVLATAEQTAYLNSIGECISEDDGETCHIDGQFISAGFPGITVDHIMKETGAPAIYFTGPVGGLLAPLHAFVWETEGPTGQPAGNGFEIPEGAELIPKNFHKQAVNGHELGKRVLSDLEDGEFMDNTRVIVRKAEFYGRLSNAGFRAGMALGPANKPLIIGKNKRMLYNCPAEGPQNDSTCTPDNYEAVSDPHLKVPVRVGDFGKSEVWYAEIGDVSLITAPAEVVSELVEGIPADFVEDPRGMYFTSESDLYNNIPAEDYHTDGYVRQAMGGRYKWMFGLAMDQLGYMIPITNFRIFCAADLEALGGSEGNCQALYDLGIMDFEDLDGDKWSMSGERCREIYTNPAVLESEPYTLHPEGADWASKTCYYGQTFDRVDGHYPETLASSWDLEREWVRAAKQVMNWDAPLDDVNPDFIGYNMRD